MHKILRAACWSVVVPFLLCSQIPPDPTGSFDETENSFEMEDALYGYQTQAYDILHTFQDHRWIPQEHVRSIELIINRLNNNPSPQSLRPIHQVLRCYQALALLCTDKKEHQTTPSKKQLRMSQLLEQRATIITQIGHAAYPAAIATLITYNLAAYLKRDPTPDEKRSYEEQAQALIEKRNATLEILNKELFEVEKKILKDPRSGFIRYGTTVLAITGVVAVMAGVIRLIQTLRPKHNNQRPLTLAL